MSGFMSLFFWIGQNNELVNSFWSIQLMLFSLLRLLGRVFYFASFKEAAVAIMTRQNSSVATSCRATSAL